MHREQRKGGVMWTPLDPNIGTHLQVAYGMLTNDSIVQPLVQLRRWGRHVLRLLQRHIQNLPTVRVHTLGYIRVDVLHPRDLDVNPTSHTAAGFTVFSPILCVDGSMAPGDLFLTDHACGAPWAGFRYVAFASITKVGGC